MYIAYNPSTISFNCIVTIYDTSTAVSVISTDGDFLLYDR